MVLIFANKLVFIYSFLNIKLLLRTVNKNSRKRIAAGNQYGIHLFPLNDRTIAAIKILSATGSKKAPKIVGPSLLAIDPSIKSVVPRNTNKIKAAQYDIGLKNNKIRQGIGRKKILIKVILFATTINLTYF